MVRAQPHRDPVSDPDGEYDHVADEHPFIVGVVDSVGILVTTGVRNFLSIGFTKLFALADALVDVLADVVALADDIVIVNVVGNAVVIVVALPIVIVSVIVNAAVIVALADSNDVVFFVFNGDTHRYHLRISVRYGVVHLHGFICFTCGVWHVSVTTGPRTPLGVFLSFVQRW